MSLGRYLVLKAPPLSIETLKTRWYLKAILASVSEGNKSGIRAPNPTSPFYSRVGEACHCYQEEGATGRAEVVPLGQRQCPAAGDKGPLTLRQPGYGSKFHNAEAVQALRDPVPQLLHYPQRPGAGKGLTQSHQKFWT